MKRMIDLLLSLVLIVVFSPVFVMIALAIRLTSPGPVLFHTRRVGKNNIHFTMYKFRSMRNDTPQVATHLLKEPDCFLNPVGGFLRRKSLDELPQLFNVLRGEMSLVGPRPALFNQDDLVALRTERGVHHLVPGITGWAQVNGRDDLPIARKVALDEEYMHHRCLVLDIKILLLTTWYALRGKGVSH